jgi:ABC-type transport system involved in multi-copper enzyme maturation permease subunit
VPRMSPLRTIGLVAGFDVYESLRSKKAIALILFYVVIALGGTAIFVSAMNRLYAQINDQLNGVTVEQLLQSKEVLRLVSKLVDGDEALANELLRIPPLALFYGWLLRAFMPLIVVLSSADAISSEVSTGSVRFTLFRADRMAWASGKLLGQTLLMVLGILVGAAACYVLGAASLDHFAAGDTAYWLLRMSFRGSFYAFAYLGIAMCASQLVRSNAAARGAGLGLALFASIAGGLIGRSTSAINHLKYIFPNAHDGALFRPEVGERMVGSAALLAIGLAWFGLGLLRFNRRDA